MYKHDLGAPVFGCEGTVPACVNSGIIKALEAGGFKEDAVTWFCSVSLISLESRRVRGKSAQDCRHLLINIEYKGTWLGWMIFDEQTI